MMPIQAMRLRKTSSGVFTYATWNPLDKTSGISLSGGDLVAQEGNNLIENVRCNQFKTTGKHYAEIVLTLSSGSMNCCIGLRRIDEVISSAFNIGQTIVARSTGAVFAGSSGASTGTGTSFVSGDRIMVAADIGAQLLWIGKNGTWMNSGNPGAGTGALFSGFTVGSGWAVIFCADNSPSTQSASANFGQSSFAYSVPSGFNSGWYL